MIKIHTKTVFDVETGAVLEDHFYEYDGPIAAACGGDAIASQKTTEANQQVALNQQLMSMMQNYQAQTTPFWTSQLANGLPGFNALTDYSKGTLAQSMAPQRAQLNRNLSGFGDTLPSGMKEQLNTDFDAQEGQAFDQNMVQNLLLQNQTKQQAAAALNPFQPAQLGSSTASSVLGAPPVNSGGIGNFLGGAVSGLLNNVSGTVGGLTI